MCIQKETTLKPPCAMESEYINPLKYKQGCTFSPRCTLYMISSYFLLLVNWTSCVAFTVRHGVVINKAAVDGLLPDPFVHILLYHRVGQEGGKQINGNNRFHNQYFLHASILFFPSVSKRKSTLALS